jgi:hypothetical protein
LGNARRFGNQSNPQCSYGRYSNSSATQCGVLAVSRNVLHKICYMHICTGPRSPSPTKLPLTSTCWECKEDCKLGRVELLKFYAKLGCPYGASFSTKVFVQENTYYKLSYDLTQPSDNTQSFARRDARALWTTRIDYINTLSASNGEPGENLLNVVETDWDILEQRRIFTFFVPAGRGAISLTFYARVVRKWPLKDI